MTGDILRMVDWLTQEGCTQEGCTHVAMESTGVFWKPIYNLSVGRRVRTAGGQRPAHQGGAWTSRRCLDIKAVPGHQGGAWTSRRCLGARPTSKMRSG